LIQVADAGNFIYRVSIERFMATAAEWVDETEQRPAQKGVMDHGVWITVRSQENRQEKDCSQENVKEKIERKLSARRASRKSAFLSISSYILIFLREEFIQNRSYPALALQESFIEHLRLSPNLRGGPDVVDLRSCIVNPLFLPPLAQPLAQLLATIDVKFRAKNNIA
jgi:hypothetical protein